MKLIPTNQISSHYSIRRSVSRWCNNLNQELKITDSKTDFLQFSERDMFVYAVNYLHHQSFSDFRWETVSQQTGLDGRLHRLSFVGNSAPDADIPQGVYIAF